MKISGHFYILYSTQDHKPLAYDPYSNKYKQVDSLDQLRIHDYQYFQDHESWFASAPEPHLPYKIITINQYLKEHKK